MLSTRVLSLLTVAVLIGTTSLTARSEEESSRVEDGRARLLYDESRDWLGQASRDTAETFTDKRNLAILGVAAVGSAALIGSEWDEEIRDWVVDRNVPHEIESISDYAGVFGPLVVDAGFYVYGKRNDDERALQTSKILLEALAIDLATTGVLKVGVGRHSPDEEDGSGKFSPFSGEHSVFPSGHTSFGFTTATVVATMYKERRGVRIASYGLATAMGLSRIASDDHWSSDVLFGAAKGYIIGKTVTLLHKDERFEKVDLVADYRDGNYVMGVGLRF
jgi:PAP2 superfamily protein